MTFWGTLQICPIMVTISCGSQYLGGGSHVMDRLQASYGLALMKLKMTMGKGKPETTIAVQ